MADETMEGAAERPSLSDVQLGRMIKKLLIDPKYKYRGRGYHRYRIIDGRWHSRQEIGAALGLSEERMHECVLAYNKAHPSPGRNMTADEKWEAYSDFIKRERRWPTTFDFRQWRTTGLPPWNRYMTLGQWADQYINQFRLRSLTPQMILTIPNLTTRRNAIDAVGIEKLIKQLKGKPFQQDDYGILWRLPTDNTTDPHMTYVEVVNATANRNEETGELILKNGEPVFDHYFLRVPPGTMTAMIAVAWVSNIPAEVFAGFAAES